MIMKRTPHGIEGSAGNFVSYLKALAEEGYIFVFQDLRGKFGSEGTFVMQRPPRGPGNPSPLDEGTDTYDTIEWLLKNVPRNNGRVGMLGISYDGWTTIMGALEPHPALKAIRRRRRRPTCGSVTTSPQRRVGLSLRLYAAMMESGDVQHSTSTLRHLRLGSRLGRRQRQRGYLHGRIPT
jgi:hypothetical protein